MAEKKIQIIYDINGKPIDVAIDKTLNLKRQVVELTKSLRSVKEGSDEFKLLSSKLGDAQDALAKTTAKSKDLFSSLSMLPGSVGSFFSELQQGIELLKVFSSFSLKDLQFQFKETANDFADIGKNLSKVDETQKQTVVSTQQLTKATTEQSTATSAAIPLIQTQQQRMENMVQAMDKQKQTIANLTEAQRAELKERTKGLAGQQKYIATQEYLNTVTAQTTQTFGAATLAGRLFGQTLVGIGVSAGTAATAVALLEAALMALGIGVIIAGIVALGAALVKVSKSLLGFKEETKENIAMTDAFVAALKREEEALGLDLEAIDLSTKAMETRAKIAGKSEQEIFEITKKGGQDRLQALRDYDLVIYKEQENATKNTKLTAEQREKLLTDINNKIIANGRAINKQIMLNEQMTLDGQLSFAQKRKELADKEYQKRINDIDAQIQLEINKDATNRTILQGLLDKKRDMMVKHDKLTYSQTELLRQENSKKVIAALDEDSKRVEAFQAKQRELQIAAIKDEQTRTEEARLQKLKQDKLALTYDYEFRKLSKEEQDKMLLNLEEAYQLDLIKIRETYFLKRYQVEQEQFLKQQGLYTQGFENLAESAKLGLQKEGKYQLLHQKTLKDFYAARFVDLRSAYQMEYDEVNQRLEQDKLRLQQALEDKKLTQEKYAEQLAAINDKIADNNQRLFDRQRQLDQLEVDAKRAQTDMLIQIGNNLVGLLQAIAGKSKKLQVAAALTEAAVSIARVVVDTSRAIIAFSASVAPLGPAGVPMAAAYAVKAKIAAALAIGTIIAQGVNKLKEINTQDETGAGTGGGTPYNGLGRNYEEGGVIRGRRHAQGGVMIEAEGGEAIMTRGAVSMFSPMLSLMNQMGGGAPFNKSAIGQASFDNPNVANYGNVPQPTIIKSYVVSQDMTSEIQKQERLKDLSTL